MVSTRWIALAFLIALLACGRSEDHRQQHVPDPFDSVKVGMTYEEVEKLLGKPTQIDRGINSLTDTDDEADFDNRLRRLSLQGLEALKQELAFSRQLIDTIKESNVWLSRKTVSSSGQLLYVTWVFSRSKTDTFKIFHPILEKKTMDLPYGPIKYLVNDQQVSKEEYDLVRDTVYRTNRYPAGWITTKQDWLERKVGGLAPPEPKKATKRSFQPTRLQSRTIVTDARRELFAVSSNFCVVFDASSGRVVTASYFPIFVRSLSPQL